MVKLKRNVYKKEKINLEKIKNKIITISGEPASGKSTVKKSISKEI